MTEPLTLQDLASRIGARVVTAGRAANVVIDRVYAGDRISDLLSHASPTALVVTNLTGSQLVRAAELMDVPGLCLVADQAPSDEMLAAGRDHGLFVMVSPVDLFETCGRLYACLAAGGRAPA
jgi:hypothetical protein